LRQGTLEQIYTSSQLRDGKVLNALAFPFLFSSAFNDPFSTDFVAYMNNPLSEGTSLGIPTPDIRWGLCATKGAWHGFHTDSDGFGTFIDVKVGKKWWIIARPAKDGMADVTNFAGIKTFLNEKFDAGLPGNGLWILEAVLLEPSTRL